MDRETCADCGKEAPQTETNYTLISAQFGWRLSRTKNPDGGLLVEWRCPDCWREYKRKRPGTITGNGGPTERHSTAPPPKASGTSRVASKSSPPRASVRPPSRPPPPTPSRPGVPRPSAPPAPGQRPPVPARRRPS